MTPDLKDLFIALDKCLAGIGKNAWADAFVELAQQTGALQVMIFSYAPNSATCLLSRNFRTKGLGQSLASEYLSGWYCEDPLYKVIQSMAAGDLRCLESGDFAAQMSAEYLARFYGRPHLGGKSAILATSSKLRLAINLYWPPSKEDSLWAELKPLLGRLALLHFEACSDFAYPAPLAVLSDRERAVCLGILSGKKSEAIAGDLGIAPSSVVTYRLRAYQKLGISSRGALFTLCGPLYPMR